MSGAAPDEAAAALRRLHPDHFRIARAALGVLLFTIAAKLAVAGREVVLAWRFGRGPEVDAYNLAMTFSTWLPLALVSVMTIVLVPVLVRLGIENSGNRTHFLRELSGAGLLFGVAMSIATWISAPWLVQWVGPGLPDATRDLFRVMLRSLAPVALLTVLVGVYATRLQAENDHRYALAEGLPPFVVVLLLLAWQSEGAAPLIVGTLAGFAWQVGWLARRSGNGGGTLQFAFSMRASQWSGLWRGALVMGAGQLAMSFTQPIDQWFAANVGSGAIATLGYANRLVSLGMALGATVISRATLPIFSEGVARGDSGRIRGYALGWAGSMLLLGIVAAALVCLAAPWLVSLLFERGAFSSMDTLAVAEALRWGIWQLPPFLAGLVLVSQLASAGRYHLIGTFAAVSTLGKVIATYLLTPQMGVKGILLASALMYSLSAALFLYAVSRPIPRQSAAAN
jgi:peptidoglycan biosynthesis protein MviN/MurJ (putative lipid II flippase)